MILQLKAFSARAPVAMLWLTLLAAPAAAKVELPGKDAPIPEPRPVAEAGVDPSATATAALTQAEADPAPEPPEPEIEPLRIGLDALSGDDVIAAKAVRDGLPDGSLDRRILTWALALGGYGEVSSGEIAQAAAELSGWPGAAVLRRNSERAVAREKPDAEQVVKSFEGTRPQTLQGTVLLTRAYLGVGEEIKAQEAISSLWGSEKLDAGEERAILKEFGDILPVAAHRRRMERMLYDERVNSAMRVAALAEAEELAEAWAAFVRGGRDAGKLLDAVPADQRSDAYIYAKAKYLRRKGRFSEAAGLMLGASTDATALVDPDAWWVERRVLSRELLDIGKPELAYEIAANHAAESPGPAADAEFHAGWYALRFLGDPQKAHTHFARIPEITSGAISQSRGYYWLARAAEAGGPGDARAYYEKAAAHGTAFYGQLAAVNLGRDTVFAGRPEATIRDRAAFTNREAVAAIRRLEETGDTRRADILYRALADELASAGELALLSQMAEAREDHYLALKVGKAAVLRGIDIGALAHPVGAIPETAKIESAGKALAYAVARQESEFRATAVSGAGARGLLQLLPGTAREMARHAGLAYSSERLTSDAGYNATLGAAFLGQQLGRFEGSYVLTFAGYNAGPGRAREWAERYGDPRGKSVEEVVDWIERIPYTETRDYVQRVMENYQVYKMRLTGRIDIAGDLVQGR
ncbi:lytic transglycosylase domain-containing protein [Aquibium sp. LZ166]|uniref:Lytic transglycosylase domain-containing protein n=1 Tax=Aquibium pacificus TaxID=3153579 RepID=A0ABV3SNF9_9HYPH